MLSKPILHSQIGKWALALTEYSLTYCPLKVVKGQIVADFIVNHSVVEAMEVYVETKHWKLYFNDSRHKDGAGIGIFILLPENIPTKFRYKIKESCSNNKVEYVALTTSLQILLDLGAKDIEIKGDSKLVVRKIKKEYKCIKDSLMLYFFRANSLLKHFDHVLIDHIPRLENRAANDLAQIASGYKISKERLEDFVKIKEKFSSEGDLQETLSISKLGGHRNTKIHQT